MTAGQARSPSTASGGGSSPSRRSPIRTAPVIVGGGIRTGSQATITGTSIVDETLLTISASTGSRAPLPASRYTNLIPRYWPANAKFAAISGFEYGTRSTSPILLTAVLDGPTTI